MEIVKKFRAVLGVLVLALALAGCSDGTGLDDEGGIGVDADAASSDRGESRFEEDGRREYDGPRGSMETEIGGYSVQGPEDEEISIPEGEADPGEVAEYAESVRATLEDGTRDLPSLVDPEAGLEGQTVNLGLDAEAVEEALEANEAAFEDLQQLDTPRGLGDVQDGLVDSRETAISAYNNINQAFVNDASADEVADAVEESLPELSYANAETRAILQELERAGNTR
ncbi:hypothetical protein GBA65_02775 [Rubrobacter marinus]|uniref:Lipoprotein n=1 Tax=Rubrobacter marinus TaxID=2653852 RepID=A0A6G8PSX8_9ACTN|nr:hypothetical protein [Rubrobacter marinus]QIN77608.1 hypothetical protein GBA65_02775 [Rubrobacter marinus]